MAEIDISSMDAMELQDLLNSSLLQGRRRIIQQDGFIRKLKSAEAVLKKRKDEAKQEIQNYVKNFYEKLFEFRGAMVLGLDRVEKEKFKMLSNLREGVEDDINTLLALCDETEKLLQFDKDVTSYKDRNKAKQLLDAFKLLLQYQQEDEDLEQLLKLKFVSAFDTSSLTSASFGCLQPSCTQLTPPTGDVQTNTSFQSSTERPKIAKSISRDENFNLPSPQASVLSTVTSSVGLQGDVGSTSASTQAQIAGEESLSGDDILIVSSSFDTEYGNNQKQQEVKKDETERSFTSDTNNNASEMRSEDSKSMIDRLSASVFKSTTMKTMSASKGKKKKITDSNKSISSMKQALRPVVVSVTGTEATSDQQSVKLNENSKKPGDGNCSESGHESAVLTDHKSVTMGKKNEIFEDSSRKPVRVLRLPSSAQNIMSKMFVSKIEQNSLNENVCQHSSKQMECAKICDRSPRSNKNVHCEVKVEPMDTTDEEPQETVVDLLTSKDKSGSLIAKQIKQEKIDDNYIVSAESRSSNGTEAEVNGDRPSMQKTDVSDQKQTSGAQSQQMQPECSDVDSETPKEMRDENSTGTKSASAGQTVQESSNPTVTTGSLLNSLPTSVSKAFSQSMKRKLEQCKTSLQKPLRKPNTDLTKSVKKGSELCKEAEGKDESTNTQMGKPEKGKCAKEADSSTAKGAATNSKAREEEADQARKAVLQNQTNELKQYLQRTLPSVIDKPKPRDPLSSRQQRQCSSNFQEHWFNTFLRTGFCRAKLEFEFGHEASQRLHFPIGIATNSQEDIIVADTGNHSIKIFSSDGKHKNTIGMECSPALHRPSAIVVGENDAFFIKDDICVRKFSKTAEFCHNIAHNQLSRPFGLAMTLKGMLVVLDTNRCQPRLFHMSQNGLKVVSYPFVPLIGAPPQSKCRFLAVVQETVIVSDLGMSCIYVTTLEGEPYFVIGRPGIGPGEFLEPSGITADHLGNVLIADSKNNRIQVFAKGGQFVDTVKFMQPIVRPSGIHLRGNRLMVINFLHHTVQVFRMGM